MAKTIDFVRVKPYSEKRQLLINIVDALIGMLTLIALVTLSAGILYMM